MGEFFDQLRSDRRLREALRLADTVPDPLLQSRVKMLLSLELSGSKPTDAQVSALVSERVVEVVSTDAPRASRDRSSDGPGDWPLIHSAHVELSLLDPQRRRDLGIVAAHVLDQALGIFAADEHLDGVSER